MTVVLDLDALRRADPALAARVEHDARQTHYPEPTDLTPDEALYHAWRIRVWRKWRIYHAGQDGGDTFAQYLQRQKYLAVLVEKDFNAMLIREFGGA